MLICRFSRVQRFRGSRFRGSKVQGSRFKGSGSGSRFRIESVSVQSSGKIVLHVLSTFFPF
jgi:hypothetical protein